MKNEYNNNINLINNIPDNDSYKSLIKKIAIQLKKRVKLPTSKNEINNENKDTEKINIEDSGFNLIKDDNNANNKK